MSELLRSTIVFPVRNNDGHEEVLLGIKAKKYGAGLWNGFGGMLEKGEAYETAAVRETYEEVGLSVSGLQLVANLLFRHYDGPVLANKAYLTRRFSGHPTPREEEITKVLWFPLDKPPVDEMPQGDRMWLPQALSLKNGELPISMTIFYADRMNFLGYTSLEHDVLEQAFGEVE